MVDRTTIGVEPSRDSPFFSALSSTTRPWNRRVEVARTVSPGSASSWLPMHRLQPGRSRYSWFSYLVRAASFGLLSSKMKPAYFARTSQSPSAFSSSTMLYVGGGAGVSAGFVGGGPGGSRRGGGLGVAGRGRRRGLARLRSRGTLVGEVSRALVHAGLVGDADGGRALDAGVSQCQGLAQGFI